MPAPQVFHVLTEFRFEAGAAIASSAGLQKAVEGVSGAANEALISFQKLSFGIVSGFLSGPGGGILGILSTAVNSSEEFLKAQVALANIMGRSAGSFADRMNFAEKSMLRIKSLASEFGLPANQLVEVTKIVSPGLKPTFGASRAISEGINLGRNFLKAAPALGLDQYEALDNVQRAIFGTIDAGDSLFRILTQDTKAMAEFAGSAAKFRDLPLVERVKKLNEAFEEYSKDLDSVRRLQMSVSGQFMILKENLTGMFSVLRPLGEAVSGIVVEALQRLNALIDGQFRRTVFNLSEIIKVFAPNLDAVVSRFMQLRQLSNDFSKAGGILTTIGLLVGLREALKFLGIRIPFVTAGLLKFRMAIRFLEADLATAKGFGIFRRGLASITSSIAKSFGIFRRGLVSITSSILKFGAIRLRARAVDGVGGIAGIGVVLANFGKKIFGFFNNLTVLITRFLGPLALLVFVFQLFERAIAIFKIQAVEKIASFMERLSESGLLFSRVLGLLDEGFNNLAGFLAASPIFDAFLNIGTMILDVVDTLLKGIVLAIAGFQGLSFAIVQTFKNMKNDIFSVFTGKSVAGPSVSEAFTAGTDSIFEKVFGKMQSGEAIGGQVTNIHTVNLNQDFKEKYEPDRIAFTVVDTLRKIGQNSTRGKGGTLATSRAGR